MAPAMLPDVELSAVLADVQSQIREHPADPKLRIYLFQLLCILGQWERAATQLELLGDMDESSLAMVQTYREVLQCELVRQSVFAGHHTPLVFGQPENWMALLIEALRATARGDHAAAQRARDAAFDEAPASAGSLTRLKTRNQVDGGIAGSFVECLSAWPESRQAALDLVSSANQQPASGPYHDAARAKLQRPPVAWRQRHRRQPAGQQGIGDFYTAHGHDRYQQHRSYRRALQRRQIHEHGQQTGIKNDGLDITQRYQQARDERMKLDAQQRMEP